MRTILICREIIKAHIDHVVTLIYAGHLALEAKSISGLYFKDVPVGGDGHVSPFVLTIKAIKTNVTGEGFRYTLAAIISEKDNTDSAKVLFAMSWEKTPMKTEVYNKAMDEILKAHVTFNDTEYTFEL